MSSISIVQPGRALQSLRDSDFDTFSAYGEIVDNSIQAGANNLQINMSRKSGRNLIDKLEFLDNGSGMDADILQRCLSLGHSSRYNDRSGIGRFGVGMTLGAIHECKRIEVYSKTVGGPWNFVYLDLEEIEFSDNFNLPTVQKKSPDSSLKTSELDSGTLVVWKKYDRLKYPLSKLEEETRFYLGRTFRKFIQGRASDYKQKLSISLNGSKVHAWDPLFHFKDFVEHAKDPKSELMPSQTVKQSFVDNRGEERNSEIHIEMSYLPAKLRQKQGDGGNSFAQSRYLDRNEGLSIMRNDREVYFGNPGFGTYYSTSEADVKKTRFIGCEISFTAELDEFFQVKNIKRGAKPTEELKKKLASAIKPTFRTYLQKVSEDWKKIKDDEEKQLSKDASSIIADANHQKSTEVIAQSIEKGKIKIRKANTEEEEEHAFNQILYGEDLPASPEELKKSLERFGVIIKEDRWLGGEFIKVMSSNAARSIIINRGSNFYKTYSAIIDGLKEHDENLAVEYRVMIDLMLASFALATDKEDESSNMTWAKAMSKLKYHWSDLMGTILEEWR